MESFQLNWDKHETNISEAFSSLRKDEHFSDVTLACEGRQFQAHRVVLSTGSSFFEQILKSQKHPSPLIYLRGVEAKHMESLLDFIYCGEVTLEQEELENFIKTGEELKVKGLSITITPTVPSPSLTKNEPCSDSGFVLVHTEDTSNEAISTAPLLPTSISLEQTSASSVEQCVKNEESEAFQDLNDEVQDRKDLKKFMTVIKKGKHVSGDRTIYQYQYQCSLCGKSLKNMSAMMSHIEKEHFKSALTAPGTPLEPASASEEQCVKSEGSEVFREIKDWEDLKRFAIVIKNGKYGSGEHRDYQCSLCGKLVKGGSKRGTLHAVLSHIECKHFKDAFTHTCDICQESFNTKGSLKAHNRRMHKGRTM